MVSKSALRRSVPFGELPEFDPVPRLKPRHDGWTPERQRAFIAALADTGCVAIAARMVNMSPESAYQLRRAPGAESFRRAWDAAQALGLQRVKDEAFDRALNGQLVPVFVAGKLMGFRRKKNDRLLMFILRHYGQDAQGRKTTINYFSTRASAAAIPPRNGEGDHPQGGGGGPETRTLSAAEASTTTVKTVISGGNAPSQLAADDQAAAILNAFEGVELDAEAQAEIYAPLEACAERRRALRTDWDTPRAEALARQAADPECDFIRVAPGSVEYLGELENGAPDDFVPFDQAEPRWESIGEPRPQWFVEWEQRQAEAEAAKALPAPEPDRSGPEPPVPSPRAPRRACKERTPKPPFTPPEPAQAEAWEARKAEAVAEVQATRREAAAAEAERRKARVRRDQSPG